MNTTRSAFAYETQLLSRIHGLGVLQHRRSTQGHDTASPINEQSRTCAEHDTDRQHIRRDMHDVTAGAYGGIGSADPYLAARILRSATLILDDNDCLHCWSSGLDPAN